MKVILTGGTGFVGSEVLRQLADDPAVTKVTCLVRRPVEIESPKVESVSQSIWPVTAFTTARRDS